MKSLLLFLSLIHTVWAGTVNLTWSAPTSGPTPTHYVIYWGTASGNYSFNKDAGNVFTTSVTDLAPNKYYFAAKSGDDKGNLSVFSNEVSATVAGPLTVTTVSIPNGVVSQPYSTTLAASGGQTPYVWEVAAGVLPPGTQLATSGKLDGVPTQTGQSSFTVQVADAAQATATKPLTLTVNAAPTSFSLWPVSATPAVVDSGDNGTLEVGIKFTSDKAGQITGIRFYKASTNTGTHVGNLWSSTGAKLGSVTFSGETASGWQQANFTNPIAIAANTTYTASVWLPKGRYSYNYDYFTAPRDAAPLHTPVSAGTYRYGTASGYPTTTYRASNYWVDVVFTPSAAPGLTSVDLAASPAGPYTIGQTVTFTPSWQPSGATVTSWNWSFGDGGTSTLQSPTHSYAQAGTYSVSVGAKDASGATVSATKTGLITVLAPPVADFTSSQARTMMFTDKSTGGNVTSWQWDFGDGVQSIDSNPIHTYTAAGNYTVTLKVIGPGGSNTVTHTITVN